MTQQPQSVPANWYTDPQNPSLLRWWDGVRWTEQCQPVRPQIAPAPIPVSSYPALPPAAPKQTNQMVRAAEVFVVRHPRWTVVVLLFVSSLLTPVSSGLAAGAWILSSVAALVWRENNLKGKYPDISSTPGRATFANALYPSSSGKTTPAKQHSMTLTQAMTQLRVIDTGLPLDEQIEVAGETYHIKDIKAVFASAGKKITSMGATLNDVSAALCPEPWNPHDQDAVAVMVGVLHVGYLPAEIAPDYSHALLRLAQSGQAVACKARIWAKIEGGAARARVTLLAPEADEISTML